MLRPTFWAANALGDFSDPTKGFCYDSLQYAQVSRDKRKVLELCRPVTKGHERNQESPNQIFEGALGF